MAIYKIQLKKELPIPNHLTTPEEKREYMLGMSKDKTAKNDFASRLQEILSQEKRILNSFTSSFFSKDDDFTALTSRGSLLVVDDMEDPKHYSVYEFAVDCGETAGFAVYINKKAKELLADDTDYSDFLLTEHLRELEVQRISISQEEVNQFNKLFGIRERLADGSYRKPQPISASTVSLDNVPTELLDLPDYSFETAIQKIDMPYWKAGNVESLYIYEKARDEVISPVSSFTDFITFIDRVLPVATTYATILEKHNNSLARHR